MCWDAKLTMRGWLRPECQQGMQTPLRAADGRTAPHAVGLTTQSPRLACCSHNCNCRLLPGWLLRNRLGDRLGRPAPAPARGHDHLGRSAPAPARGLGLGLCVALGLALGPALGLGLRPRLAAGGRLLQHAHQGLRDVVTQPDALDGRIDAGHALRLAGLASNEVDHRLLDGQVLRVLEVEVGHAARALLLQLRRLGVDLVVGPDCLEELHAVFLHNSLAVLAVAAVTPENKLLAVRGLDCETDLGEVREALALLERRQLSVGRNLFDDIDRQAVVGDERHQLVDHHVLHHAFSVPLEALVQGLRRVEAVVAPQGQGEARLPVVHEGLGGQDVLAEVPVVAHEDGDALGGGVRGHLLQLGHGGSARLLQVDVGEAAVHGRLEQLGVVRRATADDDELRPGDLRHVLDRGVEGHARLLGAPVRKLLGGRGVLAGAQEERLHDVREARTDHPPAQQLLAVVPAHAPLRAAAAHDGHIDGRHAAWPATRRGNGGHGLRDLPPRAEMA
mmetsp:Transcript_62131/g.185094  ORF Transcript_62131/g.185094 Transcript_62131/m.185094 type:complete len:504 (-) Transcript_62131:3-1514(-)